MTRPSDLREACLAESAKILRDEGPEHLSLREVARRLGVSHQAPYKHFADKDAILAELARRAYAAFAEHLRALPQSEDPASDLGAMGHAYARYAETHPFEYRLMFGLPLPDPRAHPAMLADARAAFDLLVRAVARRGGDHPERDALFVWATMHGLASLLRSPVAGELGDTGPELLPHVLGRIGRALERP